MKINFIQSVSGILLIGLLSCQDNNNKTSQDSDVNTSNQKSMYVVDTLEIHQHFVVNTEKAQLFSLPDTNEKINDFLLKDDFTEASKTCGEFVFISHKGNRDTAVSAWILRNTLVLAQITPPVIAPEDSLK